MNRFVRIICATLVMVALSVVIVYSSSRLYAASLSIDPSGTDLNITQTDINQSISSDRVTFILNILFAVGTLISVLFIAIGGFKYTISGGDPGALSSAKNTVMYAIIGLVVTVSAFIIIRFVLGNV